MAVYSVKRRLHDFSEIVYNTGMDVQQLRQNIADGTVEVDRLVEFVASQLKVIQQLQAQVAELQAQVDKLKEENKRLFRF